MTFLDIIDLPNDMLYEIFNRLDNKTLKTVSNTCKLFNSETKHILEKRRKLKTILKTWHFLSICSHWERVIVLKGKHQLAVASSPNVKTTIGYGDFVFIRPKPIHSI